MDLIRKRATYLSFYQSAGIEAAHNSRVVLKAGLIKLFYETNHVEFANKTISIMLDLIRKRATELTFYHSAGAAAAFLQKDTHFCFAL